MRTRNRPHVHTYSNLPAPRESGEVVGGAEGESLDGHRRLAPDRAELLPNYPDPFNPATTVEFYLHQTAPVSLRVYTVDGRLIETLLERTMPPGHHTVTVNAGFLASGVYLYELRAGDFVAARSMVLLR